MKLIILLILVVYVSSFSCPEHMIIWQIARDSLGETNTAIVDNLLHYMDEEDLVFSNDLEIACFMDDMKSMGFKAFSSWHYYDQPFCDGIDPEDIESTLTKDNNVYWILNQAMYTLGYSHVRDPFNGKFAKSLMLNYLIHFHGDIHSPLHLISRFTPSKPSGDLGGNLFKIEYNQYIKNLHSLWDQSMDKITYTTRPLSQSSVQYLEQMAEQIASEFTRDDLAADLEIKDFDEIAEHGFQLAKQYAYQGIEEHSRPSDEYLETRFELCKKLMALAGYRLADNIIKNIHNF